MSIPAGVVTVLVSAIPQTTSPVVPGTVSITVTPSANLIWQATKQSLATMCSTSPTPGWVVLPAVDQAGFVTPDTLQGMTDWSYLISASWKQSDGSSHTENGTLQCWSNQQVEYLSGTTGQLVPVAQYPIGGIALSGWTDTYAHLPTGLGAADAGKTYMVQADQRMYVWSGTAWPASGQGFAASGPAGPTGAVGPSGPANSLSVGTVQTGSPISITITGTAPSQTINFTLPEGHWWTGTGAPGTISGALNGDLYLDTSGNGNIYQLQSGTWVSQGTLLGPTGARGTDWFEGSGAPGTVSGAAANDLYLDTSGTGNFYKYNGSAWSLQGSLLGPTGSTGSRGATWFEGSGAPGTVTGAVANDLYLDTSGTGNWYKYNGTAWSLQGSLLGPTGATGASSTWHVGSGVPSSGLGANGDMYLNTSSGDVYGPKTAGAWGSIAENIIGPGAPAATTTSTGLIQLAGVLAGTATAPAFNAAAFGTTSTTAAAGNDSRITGAAPAASPTLTGTITLNGTVTGSGTATGATASTVALRDANANLSAANVIDGYTTTATAAGTTTLTVSSNWQQFFTGTTTQTVVLPVASTLTLGMSWCIVNTSTGTITVQSSGSNTVVTIPGGSQSVVTCILASGTTAASWSATPPYATLASPAFTGTPTVPTPSTADSSTKAASTAYVQNNLASYLTTSTASSTYAPLASPALTGTPTAPTAASGTNTTQVATMAAVQTAVQITGGTVTMQGSKTSAYTAAAGDFVPCSASSAAFTVTLPTTPSNGTRVTIMKTDTSTNAVTISRGGSSDVINVAAQTTLTLGNYLGSATLEYNAGTWYNQESSAAGHITWLVQGGTRQTGYGDLPEGVYIPQAYELLAVQFRIGTADASGTSAAQLYTNTTNASTGAALSGASVSSAGWNTANTHTLVTGPWAIAAGTYVQCDVTSVGTTPGNRLYVDLVGVWL